ncbi:NADP-dependent oxidoreductase [Paenibacillus elgii]|uniref:NADP-dependent oxidoreductase n=1 Tax=Paenibacillus elgii TaxID=189691 RepID=UPI0013D07C52|nr:NADP-dependent oxidoreductase [Paenibacillus elgii]
MKAAAFSSPGTPDVLQTMEFEDPQAGAGQVRVRVKAAGVQPFDLALRSGWSPPPGITVQLPQIPGNEFAGVVDQVGEGVTGFSVGSEVIGYKMLTCYAEYVTVDAGQVVVKPQSMPWEVAGGLSGAGQAAYTGLKEIGAGRGDTVLIHAAAGAVGTIAVQLAQAWGATVIGTTSERNHDYLRSLGAIPVAYGEGLADRVRALAPHGIDAVLDGAGGDALRVSVELVRNRERIGTLVGFDLAEELGIRPIRSQRSAARLAELADLYEQGKLRLHIRSTFPLHQAADAHREVETGHGRGKVVLTFD